MEPYQKLLIIMIFSIIAFIELRTLFGAFLGYSVSLPLSIFMAILISLIIFFVDEKLKNKTENS